MATTEEVSSVNIHDNKCDKEVDRGNESIEEGRFYDALGFSLDDLYKLSYRFFKEKEGSKAFHATYKEKLKLVALTKQIAFGKYQPDAMPEVGFFDVVGNDRKQAWQSLGEMPREKAMAEFVIMVKTLSPLFVPYIKAHLAEKEELEQKKDLNSASSREPPQSCSQPHNKKPGSNRMVFKRFQNKGEERPRSSCHDLNDFMFLNGRKEETRRLETEMLEKLHLEEVTKQQEAEKQKQVAQEMLIRSALNKQTSVQFRQYAEQQYPGNLPQVTDAKSSLLSMPGLTSVPAEFNMPLMEEVIAMAAQAGKHNSQSGTAMVDCWISVTGDELSLQQEALISQLQEQHFIQYMQQVYQQQLQLQQQQQLQLQSNIEQTSSSHRELSIGMSSNGVLPNGKNDKNNSQLTDALGHSTWSNAPVSAAEAQETISLEPQDEATSKENGLLMLHNEIIDPNDLPPIAAASMWTRKDIKEFKESLKSDSESVIKVGSGELVTVRVPTHDDGSCLFWEFATDSYDIGFGVYFEWTIASSNEMSVQVNESSEEDEEDDNANHQHDAENHEKNQENEPPTDEIIPAYRRDCHEEVYCGSHVYPGRGVYLLKFDNSYSLWRGKTVYYRVYYTR